MGEELPLCRLRREPGEAGALWVGERAYGQGLYPTRGRGPRTRRGGRAGSGRRASPSCGHELAGALQLLRRRVGFYYRQILVDHGELAVEAHVAQVVGRPDAAELYPVRVQKRRYSRMLKNASSATFRKGKIALAFVSRRTVSGTRRLESAFGNLLSYARSHR